MLNLSFFRSASCPLIMRSGTLIPPVLLPSGLYGERITIMRGLPLLSFLFFATIVLISAAVIAQDKGPKSGLDSEASANSSTTTPAAPPKAKADPIIEDLHGVRVVDPYRWKENTDSPETQQYVRDQLAYTRSVLDPLLRRDAIHERLTELLRI